MIIVSLVGTQSECLSQDYRGIRIGPFSSINSVQVNPAYHRGNDLQWDINLIGAGLDVSTNYFHFNNKSGLSLLKSFSETVEMAEGIERIEDIPASLNITPSASTNTRAHVDMEINGPGFILNLSKFSIGLFSKVSLIGHMNNLPNYDESIAITNLDFNAGFNFPKADIALLNIGQIGVSVSTSMSISSYSNLHYGINLKNYKSTDLLAVSSNNTTNATKKVDSLLLVNAELEAAFFSSYTYDLETQTSTYNPKIIGNGWGIDLGMIYENKQNPRSSDYLKLGASIVDLGYMNYIDGYYHLFNLQNGHIIEQEFLDESIPEELSKILDIDDKQYIEQTQEKTFWAPATINLLAEYGFNNRLILNISARENLPGISPVQRASYLSASAQYNRKWLGYTLPISLYNHRVLKVGSSLRLGPLTLGSDNLLPLLLPLNLRAANFYFSININSSMFDWLRRGILGSKSKNKRSGTKNVKCYYFDN